MPVRRLVIASCLLGSDDIRLALAGSWLAVAYEQTVLAIPLPPT